MSNIMALRQRKIDLVKKQRSLLDKASTEARELNETESAQYEDGIKSLTSVQTQIDREEHILELERATPVAEQTFPHQAASEKEKKEFPSFGHFLKAVVDAGRGGARLDPRLMAAASGVNESVPSEGGFAVPVDYSNEIASRAFSGGEILSRVRRRNVSGNTLKTNGIDESSRADGSRWGGVLGYWANEADTVTAKKPKFREMSLTLNKLFALYYATDEELEDVPSMSDTLLQAFSEELIFKAEDAIMEGVGAGQPLGIMKCPALVTQTKQAPAQAADTVVSDNIVRMWARMPSRNKSNAVWLINSDVAPQLSFLNLPIKNVAGAENVGGIATPIYSFPSGGGPGTLLGRPVIEVEYCATVGDLGDIVLADLSQYLLIQKASGMQAAQSMHVRFINDEMTFRITWRLDGQPIWNKPLTPFKGAAGTTLSPFITLEAR